MIVPPATLERCRACGRPCEAGKTHTVFGRPVCQYHCISIDGLAVDDARYRGLNVKLKVDGPEKEALIAEGEACISREVHGKMFCGWGAYGPVGEEMEIGEHDRRRRGR